MMVVADGGDSTSNNPHIASFDIIVCMDDVSPLDDSAGYIDYSEMVRVLQMSWKRVMMTEMSF